MSRHNCHVEATMEDNNIASVGLFLNIHGLFKNLRFEIKKMSRHMTYFNESLLLKAFFGTNINISKT